MTGVRAVESVRWFRTVWRVIPCRSIIKWRDIYFWEPEVPWSFFDTDMMGEDVGVMRKKKPEIWNPYVKAIPEHMKACMYLLWKTIPSRPSSAFTWGIFVHAVAACLSLSCFGKGPYLSGHMDDYEHTIQTLLCSGESPSGPSWYFRGWIDLATLLFWKGVLLQTLAVHLAYLSSTLTNFDLPLLSTKRHVRQARSCRRSNKVVSFISPTMALTLVSLQHNGMGYTAETSSRGNSTDIPKGLIFWHV